MPDGTVPEIVRVDGSNSVKKFHLSYGREEQTRPRNYGPFLILIHAVSAAIPRGMANCQYDREYVRRDLLPFLFTADCEPRDLTETPVAGDESWHIETVAKRGANKKALEQVEKATDSEPVKGKELSESDELKRKLSEAEERYRSGLSPKKPKSE